MPTSVENKQPYFKCFVSFMRPDNAGADLWVYFKAENGLGIVCSLLSITQKGSGQTMLILLLDLPKTTDRPWGTCTVNRNESVWIDKQCGVMRFIGQCMLKLP